MIRVLKLRAAAVSLAVLILPVLAGTQASNRQASNQQASNQQTMHQQATSESKSILGFTQADAVLERNIEEQFLRIPSGERAREWHRYLWRRCASTCAARPAPDPDKW